MTYKEILIQNLQLLSKMQIQFKEAGVEGKGKEILESWIETLNKFIDAEGRKENE